MKPETTTCSSVLASKLLFSYSEPGKFDLKKSIFVMFWMKNKIKLTAIRLKILKRTVQYNNKSKQRNELLRSRSVDHIT